MKEKSKNWLNNNGLRDCSLGSESVYLKNLTGGVVLNPKQVYASDAMEYWRKASLKNIEIAVSEIISKGDKSPDEIIKTIREIINEEIFEGCQEQHS